MEIYELIQPANSDQHPRPSRDATDPITAGTCRFIGLFTQTLIRLEPPLRNHGDVVLLTARWLTRRGEPGRFGNAISTPLVMKPVQHISLVSLPRGRSIVA